MTWRIEFDAEHGIVETLYSGWMSPSELKDAVEATLSVAREHAAMRYLSDCAGLQGGHSVFDLYGIVDFLESCGFSRLSKEAVIFPQLEHAAREVEFWETSSKNRGFNVRLFNDRDSAIAWLLESP